jgi:ubiquinol-cytochrome c reductase cytochrome c subunit
MPAANIGGQTERKPPVYSPADIDALVAYVASLGNGPALPHVDAASGDLAVGGELFRANCAACHSASGAGGALSYGEYAPSLRSATSSQVGAALRSGPGQMPAFGSDTLDDGQVNDIARYVQYLHDPSDRGGLPIGRIGPVPEGFVAWTLGMGALLAAVAWIGTRAPARRARREAISAKESDG